MYRGTIGAVTGFGTYPSKFSLKGSRSSRWTPPPAMKQYINDPSAGSVCTVDRSARLDLSSLDPVVRQPDAATSLGLIVTFVSVRCLVYPLPSLHVNVFYLTLCPSYFKRGLLQIQLRAIWQPFAMHKYLFRWEIL